MRHVCGRQNGEHCRFVVHRCQCSHSNNKNQFRKILILHSFSTENHKHKSLAQYQRYFSHCFKKENNISYFSPPAGLIILYPHLTSGTNCCLPHSTHTHHRRRRMRAVRARPRAQRGRGRVSRVRQHDALQRRSPGVLSVRFSGGPWRWAV